MTPLLLGQVLTILRFPAVVDLRDAFATRIAGLCSICGMT